MCYYYKVNAQEAIGSPARFEVGHFDPRKAPGMWKHAYGNVNQAAARVNYLNGGTGELQMRG